MEIYNWDHPGFGIYCNVSVYYTKNGQVKEAVTHDSFSLSLIFFLPPLYGRSQLIFKSSSLFSSSTYTENKTHHGNNWRNCILILLVFSPNSPFNTYKNNQAGCGGIVLYAMVCCILSTGKKDYNWCLDPEAPGVITDVLWTVKVQAVDIFRVMCRRVEADNVHWRLLGFK